MRLPLYLILACLLAASPALAQQSSKPVFGSHTCADPVPCLDSADAAALSPAQWASYANKCISISFGYANANGFVDANAGLDTAGCLTSLPGILSKGVGGQLSPRCCVTALPNSTCAMHCDLATE